MSGMIRSMARAIAKENMRKNGYTRADRGKQNWSEFFSKNWRKFVSMKKRRPLRKAVR